MNKEVKTGQSTDIVKDRLLGPILLNEIIQVPVMESGKALSVIDLGTGDASYSWFVINQLIQKGILIDNVGLLDADTEILPDLLTTTLKSNISSSIQTQMVEAKSDSIVGEFLRQFEEHYDVAISQLVLHQVLEDYEMSHFLNIALHSLNDGGNFFVVDLHPKFVRYLMNSEPKKFIGDENCGVVEGEYHFDSGGSVKMKSREIPQVLSVMLGLGFDFVGVKSIIPESIAETKERYREIADKQIPMFFLMQLKKNKRNFISSTKGVVKLIRPGQENGLSIVFVDDEQITIPNFPGSEDIIPGNIFSISEVYRAENDTRILSYWIYQGDQQNPIGGGQSAYKIV